MGLQTSDLTLMEGLPQPKPKLWQPKRVFITKSASSWDHGRFIAERAAGLGIPTTFLDSDRLPKSSATEERKAYAWAKSTLAVVVASPSRLKLKPIAPSADWRVDLAEGCPAHCSYCYLAGSLKGAPLTRVYANLPEIIAELPRMLGQGTITSRSKMRAAEGTTYEASCYTDPLGIEHLTGSLSTLIAYFGSWDADAQLRFTTKFDAVERLICLAHKGKTRVRFSLNPAAYAQFEGGTAPVAARLIAMRRLADAGYKIGLTIAPIIAAQGWERAYGGLIGDVATTLAGAPHVDLTVELITHRFSPTSREVLTSWYPGSALDMTSLNRTEKRTKFGSIKHVYDAPTMQELRGFFEAEIAAQLPRARILYWT